ncbi:GlmU family protein [Niabella terrae]
MQVIFSDRYLHIQQLYPFALTRNVEDIRVGIFTIREKWIRRLGATAIDDNSDLGETSDRGFVITSNVLPNDELIARTRELGKGEKICDEKGKILVRHALGSDNKVIEVAGVERIEFPWDIFRLSGQEMTRDFDLARTGRKGASPHASVQLIQRRKVFLEKGCEVRHVIINATEGPVFIEKDALVMEGTLIRGPVYIGAGSVVKMGTKIYGGTSIGPGCTVGGELKNAVLLENSNKAHDGYLGDAVIGAWCNLGAGTTNSNLKNNAGAVNVSLQDKDYLAGQKCGMFMGDYSRTAINTSVNTGTVIGVSANVFGTGLTPRSIPSFSWGFDGRIRYELDKALQDAAAWKALKGAVLTDPEKQLLKNIYQNKTKIRVK